MEYTIIEPDFFKDFACIAGACRHNCCKYSWRVMMDKKTYKMYKSLRQPKEIAEKLQSPIIYRNPDADNDTQYGMIRMNSGKDDPNKTGCVLLNERGLCEIQLALGGDKLCSTCREYPRITANYMENVMENNLFLDCEAVLEILYNHTEPIRCIKYTVEMSQNDIHKMVWVQSICKESKYYDNYLNVKAVGLAIMQDREYCVEDRLVHFGIFCHKLDKLMEEDENADVDAFCDEFVNLLIHRSFDDLKAQKPNYKIQLLFANQLLPYFNKGISNNKKDVAAIDANILGSQNEDELTEKYKRYIENFNAFMDDKQIFLENLMVTIFNSTAMPLSMKTARESFYTFAANYILLRYLISGYMGEKTQISHDELIDLCASLEREILHQADGNEKIVEYLKRNNADNLAYVIMLLKS